jgi:hypothetical protein
MTWYFSMKASDRDFGFRPTRRQIDVPQVVLDRACMDLATL